MEVIGKKEEYSAFRGDTHHERLKKKVSMIYIKNALTAIHEGVYGVCIACGEKIPINRLKIVPGAVRCTSCEEKIQNQCGGILI